MKIESTVTHAALSHDSTLVNSTANRETGPVKIGMYFDELKKLKLPPRDEIIYRLPRGHVGMLNASSNAGKSTFCRNMIINLCTGRPFGPVVTTGKKRRVALLDCEEDRVGLRSDLIKMCSSSTDHEQKLIGENLFIICEQEDPDGNSFNLSNPPDFDSLVATLNDVKPDFIVVDTVSSAFRMRSENDNCEVKNEVMNVLRHLARKCNAAVFATHHVGKWGSEQKTAPGGSHKGRGASAFGDHSYLVLNLDKKVKDNTLRLECGKAKGPSFPDTIFSIDAETRQLIEASKAPGNSHREILLSVLEGSQTYSKAEIAKRLDGRIPERSFARELKEASESGDLVKPRHGHYQKVPKCQAL